MRTVDKVGVDSAHLDGANAVTPEALEVTSRGARAMDHPVSPITDLDWPEAIMDMRSGFAGTLNVYRVMAHNPPLLRAWSTLLRHLVVDSGLGDQQKELVILRTEHHWRSRYEWAHYVVRGAEAGLSDARIMRAAMAKPTIGGEDDEDGALLLATDTLLREGTLPAATLGRLRLFLDDAALMDLMATIGMYSTPAFLANSFATPIDADVLHAAGPTAFVG